MVCKISLRRSCLTGLMAFLLVACQEMEPETPVHLVQWSGSIPYQQRDTLQIERSWFQTGTVDTLFLTSQSFDTVLYKKWPERPDSEDELYKGKITGTYAESRNRLTFMVLNSGENHEAIQYSITDYSYGPSFNFSIENTSDTTSHSYSTNDPSFQVTVDRYKRFTSLRWDSLYTLKLLP